MSHLESLEAQRDELNRQAQELQRRIDLKEFIMTNEITVREHPAQLVASWRTTTTYADVFAAIPEGFGRVMTCLGEENVAPSGAPFTLFYQAPDGDTEGDIAMSVPISAPFAPSSDTDVEIVDIPAGPTAAITHRGSYANMGESYATVVSWINQHGHQIVGPAREIYLNSPADTADEDLLTEIHFPIDADEAN